MDNINVLVLEDNTDEGSELARLLAMNNFTVTAVAATNAEALALLHKQKVDVVIIDIFLNGYPDGISFAETISASPAISKPFVFLTGSNDRQIFERARLTRPFSYLVKPYNELELLYSIEMAVERFYAQNGVFNGKQQDAVFGSDCLFIKKKNSLKKVDMAEIIYIEVEERYCNIVTTKEKFVILISLARLMELLDKNKFIRTHRNYMVNSEHITEVFIADNLVMLKGDHHVALSDHYREFLNRFVVLK